MGIKGLTTLLPLKRVWSAKRWGLSRRSRIETIETKTTDLRVTAKPETPPSVLNEIFDGGLLREKLHRLVVETG